MEYMRVMSESREIYENSHQYENSTIPLAKTRDHSYFAVGFENIVKENTTKVANCLNVIFNRFK